MRPLLQLVRPANSIESLLPRLQASEHTSEEPSKTWRYILQMIRVVETQTTARLLKLLGRDALETSLRGHWHEYRQRDGAVWKPERAGASSGRLRHCPELASYCADAMESTHRAFCFDFEPQCGTHCCDGAEGAARDGGVA